MEIKKTNKDLYQKHDLLFLCKLNQLFLDQAEK